MAVTLISRPLGHKLGTAQVQGQMVDGSGDAVAYVPGGHSLSDGDYVYIESNIEAYNGFKYVDATAYDYFKIKDSENGDYTPYYQDADIVLYISELNHGWQCVHLPIVYELQSDIWPNNVAEEEYNPNVVDSFENSNGYVQLNLDHALSDPTALSYIELVGDGALEGKYQIIEVVQPWSVVINLAYDSAYDFSGYTIVRYYNNYHINVEVWSGLETGHRWEALKPFELAATLKFIPDSEGNVKFSIHDILKGYIQTRNNLTLETLPNNIDFHTSFYIKYYESYDESDGEEITVFDGDQVQDEFIGHAVNSMMPFKSFNSGFMSDYVGLESRWLTLFDRPVAVVGHFFDLSFINTVSGISLLVYINGLLDRTIVNHGSGVIRVALEFDTPGEYCVTVFTPAQPGFTPAVMDDVSTWSNIDDAGKEWVLEGSTPMIDSRGLGLATTSDKWATAYSFVEGVPYSFEYEFQTGTFRTFYVSILDVSNIVLADQSVLLTDSTSASGIFVFVAPPGAAKISIHVFSPASCGDVPGGFCSGRIISFVNVTESNGGSPEEQIMESICIDVVEECGTTFTDDNLRITDGSDLRKV
jgi:hypothetical protein